MIVLFTDFGDGGPYVGQMKAVLAQHAPAVAVIDLLNDAPAFDVTASAHLLAAYMGSFPVGTIFLAIIDPTVGSAERKPVIAKVDGRYFVGPGNGLFDVVAARGSEVQWWEIDWRPESLSHSFHGRDLFAPVAARLAMGEFPQVRLLPFPRPSVDTGDLCRIIYIDHYGNAITGLRAGKLDRRSGLRLGETLLRYARTFSSVPHGQAFWYENANGLVEIAANQGHAARLLSLGLGDTITIVPELR